MPTLLIYSHRRALAFWLAASGVLWIAALWIFDRIC